jgi:hypothetical protein
MLFLRVARLLFMLMVVLVLGCVVFQSSVPIASPIVIVVTSVWRLLVYNDSDGQFHTARHGE